MGDDHCSICAEPLEFCAFGPCNHREVCVRCIARLRFVIKSKACPICKVESDFVMCTRYQGDYTTRMSNKHQEMFQRSIDSGGKADGWLRPRSVNIFFDDEACFKDIRKLCSFTHPALAEHAAAGNQVPHMHNLGQLKKFVSTAIGLSFCDLCLQNRHAFVCEQKLFTKEQLAAHNEQGGGEGEAPGFKGHPKCKYCRKRMYDVSALYNHMETQHEHCFLCRRANPDRHMYYRDYKHLEDHFNKHHFPCHHSECLEKKFVVFAEESELKRHIATEHGQEYGITASQRREAMRLDAAFRVRRPGEEEDDPGADDGQELHHSAVRIGGGEVFSRFGRRTPAVRAAAAAASRGGAAASNTDIAAAGPRANGGAQFSEEHFPAMPQSSAGSLMVGSSQWLEAAGATRRGNLNLEEDFPALPGMSKSAKKRAAKARQREAALASQVVGNGARPGGGVSIVHRAAPPAAAAAQPQAAAASSNSAGSDRQSAPSPQPAAQPGAAAAGTPMAAAPAAAAAPAVVRTVPGPAGRSRQEDFPALSAAAAAGPAAEWTVVPARQQRSAAAPPASTANPPSISCQDDFPTLGGARAHGGSSSSSNNSSSSSSSRRKGEARPSRSAAPAAVPAASAAARDDSFSAAGSSAAGSRRVSEELKAANQALIDRIRMQLDDQQFASFKSESGDFMKGSITAKAYHGRIVELGLVQLVFELASLCPQAERRQALMEEHVVWQRVAEAEGRVGSNSGWVPPEAAAAAASQAISSSSWQCSLCTLINARSAQKCAACGTDRKTSQAMERNRPRAGGPAPEAAPSIGNAPRTANGGSEWSRGMRPGPDAGWAPAGGQSAQPEPAQAAPSSTEDFPALPSAPAPALGQGEASSEPADVSRPEAPSCGRPDADEPAAAAGSSSKGKKKKQGKFERLRLSGIPNDVAQVSNAGVRCDPGNSWSQGSVKAHVMKGNSWAKQGPRRVAPGGSTVEEWRALQEAWSKPR